MEWAAPPVDVVCVWVSWEGACGSTLARAFGYPPLGRDSEVNMLSLSFFLSRSKFSVVFTGDLTEFDPGLGRGCALIIP